MLIYVIYKLHFQQLAINSITHIEAVSLVDPET